MSKNEENKRGLGSPRISPERRREISSIGGKAAHASGRAHEFTSDEAREAGRKGGEVTSADREHMSAIGRLGGMAKHRKGRRS